MTQRLHGTRVACRWPAIVPLLVVASSVGPATLGAQTFQVEDVAWLAGCWRASEGRVQTDEHWMAPEGGMMVGMSRALRGGRASGFELMVLDRREAGLTFSAFPSGQQPTAFIATRVGPGHLRVENADHDFPKAIEYAQVGTDSLRAAVFGDLGGADPAFVVRYARRPCAG